MKDNNQDQSHKKYSYESIKQERSGPSTVAPDLGKTDHYRTDKKNKSGPTNASGEYKWVYSHVGLGLVNAITYYHALALASTAFKRREGGDKTSNSYDLLHYFDSTSKTITSNWETNLPGAVKFDSYQGRQLIKEALEISTGNSDFKVSDELTVNTDILNNGNTNHYIYTEESEPITSESELPKVNDGDNDPGKEEWWVVPALLYKRKRRTEGRQVAFRECSQCGHTRHVHLKERDGDTVYPNEDRVWACLSCDQLSKQAPPRNSSYGREETLPVTGGEYTERDHFEEMMERLEEEGQLEEQ